MSPSKHKARKIDKYIKYKLNRLSRRQYLVEPSHNFTKRVMLAIVDSEKRQSLLSSFLVALLGLSPFLTRELWFLIRKDYFSVSDFPLGTFILKMYGIFISPVTAYVFLILGVGFILRVVLLRRSLFSRWFHAPFQGV